jgi:putative alpha-1,2-mannosidase
VFQARSGLKDFFKLGYVPYDHGVRESVACTLEYAHDDFALAQMAKALGKDDDYKMFTARSRNNRNVYDARVGFMRGRKSDGSWIEPFDPLAWGGAWAVTGMIHEMTEARMGDMGQYAHVNEPVYHVAYLYHYAGQPWKTQRLVRMIEDGMYQPGPEGWLGDEDTGQMSSWYIFSALGFYPVNPGHLCTRSAAPLRPCDDPPGEWEELYGGGNPEGGR